MSRHPTRPVEPVKESYYCPHCTNILRAAVQTIEGDRLCDQCCEEIRGMPSSKCAKCGISILPGSQVYPDRAARREIDELVVYCPYVDTGCQWQGKLKDMEEHARKCSFKRVKCPHIGCEAWMTTSQLEHHVRDCVYRQVKCKYCGQDMQYNQLAQHYERICQEFPEPCKQCGKPVSRRDMPHHLEEVCDNVKCKVCDQLVNRKTKQEVGNGHNGPVHLSSATAVFEHNQVLVMRIELVHREQEVLKTSMQELQDNTVSLESFKQLQSRTETLAVDIETRKTSNSDFDDDFRTQFQELQRKVNRDMERQLIDLKHQIKKMASDFAGGASVGTKGPVNQQSSQDYTVGSLHSTRSYHPSGFHSESTAENRIMHLEKNVEELQRTTALIKVHLAELELQLQASLASTHNGIFLWRIPEIRRRKRDAFEGRITSIYSPPFYSGRHGYKMCIRAYLNGDGIGYSTHLSVFFVVMRGEYDALLKWPFESKVSLILVDQTLRQHVIQTFKPTPESSSFQKPQSDMNVASGCPKFAELSVLEEGKYVKDDVLFLKCIVDTSKIQHP